MKSIRQLLENMGAREIIAIGPDASVFDAVTRMVENNVGAILVLEGGDLHGIMSERDYLRFISQIGKTARDTPVRDLMTTKIIYVTPETEIEEVMAIMTEARIRHMPVMAEGRLQGIISMGDLVKQISRDREVHIRTLEAYISDGYPGPDPNLP